MQIVKRLLVGCAGFVVLIVVVSLAVPKSAHGLVAALVQVTNTTANPAVTLDADKAMRIPYESASQAEGFAGTCGDQAVCQFNGFTVVPTGYRLVVQQIAGIVGANSANPMPNGEIVVVTDKSQGFPIDFFTGTYLTNSSEALFHQTGLLEFVNAGSSPSIILYGDLKSNTTGYVIVTGYLESCSVTGCPPIQN